MGKTPTLPHVSFASFSDGYDDGFKQGDDINHFMSELERRGSQAIKDMIVAGVEQGQPFTCIVYSILLPWVAIVARSLHLPAILLWIQPAIVFALYYYYNYGYHDIIQSVFDDPLATIQLPGLPLLTARDLPSFFGSSDAYEFALPIFRRQFELLEQETNPMVVINTFDELEHDALRAISNFHLIPVGPLIPSEASSRCDLFQSTTRYDIVHFKHKLDNNTNVILTYSIRVRGEFKFCFVRIL